jgi:ketosteroid isomerase-like protein
MPTSRRNVLAVAGAGLATIELASRTGDPALAHSPAVDNSHVDELIKRSAASNAALMRGDIDTYRALIGYTDDFTLMSPFGGTPSRGSDYTPERMERMGRFFRNGTFSQELVQAYGSSEMVVLAIIERSNVEVGGLPAQDWALRVTLVFRREGSEWRLAHRHADPIVESLSLQQAAAIARGER